MQPIGGNTVALGISENAFNLMRDLITDRLGIHYDDSKRDLLADKVSHLIAAHGMHSFLDYYYLLKYDADAEHYWHELMNSLSVPETYFWRQPDQLLALAEIAKAHFGSSRERFRIWSAACCTGEEPISMLMALKEAGIPLHKVAITASDASPAMLEKARNGVYSGRSFRNLPAGWQEKYFAQTNGGWRVHSELHGCIEWRRVNLLNEAEIVQLPCAEVVFCRNVFIYFSDEAIQKAAAAIAGRMPTGGHLFLGSAESLTRWPTDFSLEEVSGAFVYINRREQAETPAPERIAS